MCEASIAICDLYFTIGDLGVFYLHFNYQGFFYHYSGGCMCGSNAACAQDMKDILGDTCTG